MSARTELPAFLLSHGWWPLGRATPPQMTPTQIVYYRWLPETTREELCICFDAAGRVEAWTVWHNKRVAGPDQDRGRRIRLTDHITARTP